MLHCRLQDLYHQAKLEPPDISDARHWELVCRAQSMARAYAGLDDEFAVRLENAAPDLFTFIRHPGMDPTNNESERVLRKVVIHRKIRQKLVLGVFGNWCAVPRACLLYTSPSPRDRTRSRMPSSA